MQTILTIMKSPVQFVAFTNLLQYLRALNSHAVSVFTRKSTQNNNLVKLILAFMMVFLLPASVAVAQVPLDPPSITRLNSVLTEDLFMEPITFTDTSIFVADRKDFILGHQWGTAPIGVNKRLHMNTYNGHPVFLAERELEFPTYPQTTGKPTYLSWQPREEFVGWDYWTALQFDPEGSTSGLLPPYIAPDYDTTGAIFGFSQKRAGVRGSTGSGYTNRYLYITDSVPSGDTGIIILSKPLGTESMARRAPEENIGIGYNGTRWYVAINLRRKDSTWDSVNNMQDTVLTIKLPYRYIIDDTNGVKILSGNKVIQFDSISSPINLTGKGYYPRGRFMDNYLPAKNDSVFVIRRSMLPKYSDTCDITLSAFFRANDTINNFFRAGGSAVQDEIDSLNMEVRYFGKCNVAIDWIRLETPDARALFRGEKDLRIAKGLSNLYKHVKDLQLSLSGARLWRFYSTDEPSPLMYRAHRYYSYLVEHNIHTEGGVGTQYQAIVPEKNYWGSTPHYQMQSPIPFAKYSGTWGYKMGWDGFYLGPKFSTDSLNNDYRTDGSAYELYSSTNKVNNIDGSTDYCATVKGLKSSIGGFEERYKFLVENTAGLLAQFDKGLYYGFRDSKYMYNGKPWLCNFWTMSEWIPSRNDSGVYSIRVEYNRPQTGEEFRQSASLALILGAKGFMYDRFHYTPQLNDLQVNDTLVDVARMGVMGGYQGISSTVIDNDTSGNFLLNSEATGSDYLHTGDYSHIDQYCNLQKVADSFGVDTNHIYIGRKSTRLEIMKLHDRINVFGDTLMRLQLQGWYGKGLREFRSMKNNDSTLLTNFLILDSAHVKTRPINRSYADGWDTTYCDITIHKDTSISMDSVFTIGVLNRRTNPLIRPIGDSILRFYPTAEFDSLTLHGDSLWKTQRYNQGGSREITIPFNYHSSHGYALLRVRELGGGIDTVIGQDRGLAVKFLPGEGKMFNVTVLQPDTTLAGNLSYTNQRKLVGFFKHGSTDTMYYHLTYHKPNSDSTTAVYYRRSEPILRNSSTQNIIWQNELLVSKNIRSTKGNTTTMTTLNCAYPSLVVRYDSTSGINKVYIVYACVDEDTCFYSARKRIVETVLSADATTQYFNLPLMAETLGKFHGSLEEYGTPMINASDSGNYYCWADSLLGIVVGWKRTGAQYLLDTKNISYHLSIGQIPVACKHPSLNSYSRIELKEKDCALVWQEKCYSGDNVNRSRILYTRLQMINGILNPYLPPTLSPANGVQILGPSGCIAELNYGGSQYANHHIPSVYREISDNIVYSADQQRDMRFDCVSWHSYEFTSNPGSPLGAIYRRTLSIYDTNGVANLWGSDGISRIRASSAYLGNVSLSQGDAELVPIGGYMHNLSARSHIMTFTESPVFTYGGSPPYRKLWQIQSNTYFAPSFHDTSLASFQSTSKAFVIDNDGAVGQTAALPRMNTQEEWRKNRRVYEGVTVSSLRRIQASAEYFLKQTASSESEPSIFSGFHDGESTYMLSNPILNGSTLSLERVKRLRGEAGRYGGRHGFTDTLETNWFTVGDEANLMLKSIGKNADLVSAFVERRSDGERFAVQLRTSDDTTALWTRIPLLRGGVEEYRFFMVKNSVGRGEEVFTIPDYGEEMVLGEMKTSISFNKGNNDIQAIDLGRKAGAQASIRVFPNPAQDKVSVVVLGNNPKDVWHIKVMNVLGDVMSEHNDKTSSLLEIVTEEYPSGVYYITAESGRLNATARFVIMK